MLFTGFPNYPQRRTRNLKSQIFRGEKLMFTVDDDLFGYFAPIILHLEKNQRSSAPLGLEQVINLITTQNCTSGSASRDQSKFGSGPKPDRTFTSSLFLSNFVFSGYKTRRRSL